MDPVNIPCICAAAHPDGDTVTLRDPLPFRIAVTLRQSVAALYAEGQTPDVSEITGGLMESYLLYCIESWSLVDDEGRPLPVTKVNIRERILDNLGAMIVVRDAADEQYAEAVMLPLVRMGSSSSPPMPTGRSTSATNGSAPGHPRPSRRSSTSTTRTDATATTSGSLAGASS